MKVSGDTADTADGRGVLDGDGGQRAGQGRQETDLPLRLSQSYSNTGETMCLVPKSYLKLLVEKLL
jgi:hypothetical protein